MGNLDKLLSELDRIGSTYPVGSNYVLLAILALIIIFVGIVLMYDPKRK